MLGGLERLRPKQLRWSRVWSSYLCSSFLQRCIAVHEIWRVVHCESCDYAVDSSSWSLRCDLGVTHWINRQWDKRAYHVVMLEMSTQSCFRLFSFDSMLGTWKGVGVQHPPWSQSGWCPTQYQALPFKGALHWLAEDGPVVAYNPNDQNTCLLIHRSHDMSHASSYCADAIVSETLTVSTGHLRILQLVASVDHQHLYIWTLVDYKRSIWRREHDDPISFTDLPWLQDWTFSDLNYMFMSRFVTHPETRKRILYPKPLCCHPYNPLLVYFCLPESIVSLDVATRQMKLITTLSKSSTQGVHWNEYDKVIPMTMQLDPSLIPDHGHVLQRRCKHRFFRV